MNKTADLHETHCPPLDSISSKGLQLYEYSSSFRLKSTSDIDIAF
jgi:hypothetical protein